MYTQFEHEGEALLLTNHRQEELIPQSAPDKTRAIPQLDNPALPEALRAAAIATIQKDASDVYSLYPENGAYQAINPQHEFQIDFFPVGVALSSTHDYPAWRWGMQLTGYGYGEKRERLPDAELHSQGNRMEYRRDQITEWYLNGPLGLEQGFTLHTPPDKREGDDLLVLEIEFQGGDGVQLAENGRQLLLKQGHSLRPLQYGHLYVQDATEHFLPVHMELLDSDPTLPQAVRIYVDDRGAVYPLVVDPLVQQQQAKVTASDGAARNLLGESVAVYDDTIAIGAYGTDLPSKVDAGAVYVFVRNGTTWTQQAKLTASDAAAGDLFGNSVTIYGNTIAVGANSVDLTVKTNAGAVYVFTRSGTTWTQQQKIDSSDIAASDFFGIRCALYQDTLVVAASSADLPGKVDAGAVYVFTRSGTTWTQQAKLTASDAAAGMFFGAAVDIYLDTAIVTGNGALYVFTRSGTTWTQQQRITASDATAADNFGYWARINGDSIIVGAPNVDLPSKADAGAAYVFVRSGSTWTQEAKLTASDAAAGDTFGYTVDIAVDTAIIGAPAADLTGKTNAGAAYIFTRSGSTWTQTDKITASDATANDALGYCIALHGSTVVLGAPTDDAYNNTATYNRVGSAYLFTLINPFSSPNSGAPHGNLSWAGEVVQNGSLNLRTGEKIETATDLVVYTMVDALDFTRTYRQAKHSVFTFMGLGWQHSHAATLTTPPGASNKRVVQLPNGGELNFRETTSGSNVYKADAGSDAVISYNTGTSQYTLSGTDKSQYIFDVSGKLIQRIWPPFGANAANWLYTYDGSGRLISVEDRVDSTHLSGRKLIFVYISNPGQYNDGKLWRIGDQDTTNLTGSPSGRYVEFTYTPQKNNGGIIASPNALLNTVRDALGNIWTYKYYGQVMGETNTNQLDFLVSILSPSVDTTGDGVADGTLTLEQLSYTTSGSVITNLTQNQGNSAISTAYAFQPSGQNTTTETVVGKTGTHTFNNGVYGGFTDPAGNNDSQTINFQYRPVSSSDANNQQTLINWSFDGKFLQQLTDAVGNITTYSYNSNDTLDYEIDAELRKTQYIYGDANNPLLPTAIKFFDTNWTTVLRWQTFSYDLSGRLKTAKLMDPANGTTIMQEIDRSYYTVAGNGFGLLQVETIVDPITPANNSSTTYTYDSKGRVIKTQKTSMFGCCQFTYTVYDDADHIVALVNSTISQTPPTTRAAAVALYDAANPDKNRITSYYYDQLGRLIGTILLDGASYAVVEALVYDALGRVIRSMSHYVPDAGIPNPYTASRSSFNHGTNVDQNLITDSFYNARGMLRKRIDPLDNVTLYGYDDAGRLVKIIQNAANGNYNNDYTGTTPDPALASYSPVSNADQDLVTTQAYDKAGNLVKTVDATGVVTYSAYDGLNRVTRVVKAAKDTATISLNVGDTGYNAANDPRSVSYVADPAPDRDLIETTTYDRMGRVILTQRLLENRPTLEKETILYGYDGLGRSVKIIDVASNAAYNIVTDPTLGSYGASSSVDQDLVTRTAYDKAERVLYTEDNFGSKTWTGYDGLGRPVKNIANAVGTATDGSANDPRSATYVPNAAADKDMITVTAYNSDGRVLTVTDALGRVTRYIYDTVGRVTRTVQNFVDQGEDPSLWVYSNGWKKSDGTTVISNGTDNDQNIVSSAIYDGKGRVSQTMDHRNNVTLNLYDAMDRVIKMVTNYVVQGASQPVNWVWSTTNNRWEDGAGNAIAFGTDNDQNRITTITYDLLGRRLRTRDAAGMETRYTLDLLGRPKQTITDYVDGIFNSASPDEDLTSTVVFNKTGQITSTTDVRGTQTAFTYDKVYRTLTLTRAASTSLSSVNYTCYDKAGRVQRTIQNWSNTGSPDSKDANGNWTFVPSTNGANSDTDLTLDSRFDKASRPLTRIVNYRAQGTSNPSNWIWSTTNTRWEDGAGNPITFGTNLDQNLISLTSYYKNGQADGSTDPAGTVTKYRYDLARRQTRMVQGFVDQGQDPALWVWASGTWQTSTGTGINFGTNNDQNIVTDSVFDKMGRQSSQRDAGGGLTAYSLDKRNRRKSITNPLGTIWSTVYTDLVGAGISQITKYPGITGAANYNVQQDSDRIGRLLTIQYNDPTTTPDVKMTYDAAGNRSKMSEYSASGFSSKIRETQFGYDKAHRLTSAAFDNDGNGTIDETVSYTYDAGGLKTKLTLPGSLNVNYLYDARGRLTSLTDWDSQQTQFGYDFVDRHLSSNRANSLNTQYTYDAASRLSLLKHINGNRTLASFSYLSDKRGNRIQAQEALANIATTTDTTIASTDKGLVLTGTWSDVSGFKESVQTTAILKLIFLSNLATLTMGKGPDHSQYDLYIDGVFWQTRDGYAATATQEDITVPTATLVNDGPHVLEVRNKNSKNASSSGFKVRFKQLVVVDKTWTMQTVEYTYDKLMRVQEARYNPGMNTAAVDADLQRRYLYTYDRMSNRKSESVALNGGTPTVKNWSYNLANRINTTGYTYDANGNLTADDLSASYTWDRANRLIQQSPGVGTTLYKYDGFGNRIRQEVDGFETGVIFDYLLDLQPGLAVTLVERKNTFNPVLPEEVTRYVHSIRGIHAHKDASNNWEWMLPDALGSVRIVTDNTIGVLESRNYGTYGDLFGTTGTSQTTYGYTGEPNDSNGLIYDRARYMSTRLGQFLSLDPKETYNRYAYVMGNPVMRTDSSGLMLDDGTGGSVSVMPPKPTYTQGTTPGFGSGTYATLPSQPASQPTYTQGTTPGFGSGTYVTLPVRPTPPPTAQPTYTQGTTPGFGSGTYATLPTKIGPKPVITSNTATIIDMLNSVLGAGSRGGGSTGSWVDNKQAVLAPIVLDISRALDWWNDTPLANTIRQNPLLALTVGIGVPVAAYAIYASRGEVIGPMKNALQAMAENDITSNAFAGGAGYLLGTTLFNALSKKQVPLDLGQGLTYAAYGAAIGIFNKIANSAKPNPDGFDPTDPFIKGGIMAMSGMSLNLYSYDLAPGSKRSVEGSMISVLGGTFNAMTGQIPGPLGTLATTTVNAFFTALALASDASITDSVK